MTNQLKQDSSLFRKHGSLYVHGYKSTITGSWCVGVGDTSGRLRGWSSAYADLATATAMFNQQCDRMWPELARLRALGISEEKIDAILDVYAALDDRTC